MHNTDLYTTAYDLSLIARYAMNNSKFRNIVKTFSYTLPKTDIHTEEDRVFSNSNLLLDKSNNNYYYGATTGIKTGFTDQAGDCLVASAKKDNVEFIAVILHSGILGNNLRGKFLDCKTLFDFAFDNYTSYYKNLQEENSKNPIESILSIFKGNSDEKELTSNPDDNIPNKSINSDYSGFLKVVYQFIAAIVILLILYYFLFGRKSRVYKRKKRKPRK